MPRGFEDIVEADDVALDVGIGVLYTVAHSGLGGEVDDDIKTMLGKESVDKGFVGKVALYKVER